MSKIIDTLRNWPRSIAGQVIFESSEDAIFYAALIYDDPDRVKEIKSLRRSTLVEIGLRRAKKQVNLDLLMHIACKAQFYRECVEEVDRLKDHVYTLAKGGK